LPYVTVNLSAHQFHDPGLVSMIERALACIHRRGGVLRV
jgi:sensor c-di-GMP phosphodiesterase-like protein